ncbi:30S ribosomal protein S9 [Candidatus Persebacteraceae bacterium Df01]|jgi:small subunit ribosomal protein S9|uniref:Small ribosomal subunit protein uS9 n=1 Tax=Candidatus Doriopsillibacter californiensis TaxID=2970740 RepID=A0ABT7QL82_9GAMM|nr:30S ribosomal protein S9 [Candidatus Persebacteraceae bacterium Df01]
MQGKVGPYDYGTGRRKTSCARVFLSPGKGNITVNGKALETFFCRLRSQIVARQSLSVVDGEAQFDLRVTVRGGGESSQAAAMRHGTARALAVHNPDYIPVLRAAGLMTRDSRKVERKKVGLRKARRATQYSKR